MDVMSGFFSGSLIFSANCWFSFFSWIWRGQISPCMYTHAVYSIGTFSSTRVGGGVKKRVPRTRLTCSTRCFYFRKITTKRALNLFVHPWIFRTSIMQSNSRDYMCNHRLPVVVVIKTEMSTGPSTRRLTGGLGEKGRSYTRPFWAYNKKWNQQKVVLTGR